MSLFKTDDPLFDYDPYPFGRRQQFFRGPVPDLRNPYIVCLGATHTFGRFTSAPFPSLIARGLGRSVVNFGIDGAGPGLFLADAEMIHVASGADLCIVEVMSARAISNRMFTVHQNRNERLVEVSDLLKGLYPDVEISAFQRVKGMLRALERKDPDRFRLVHNEMRNAWIARMQALLNEIECPKILLWFAGHAPPDMSGVVVENGGGPHPAFVDGAMLDAVEGNHDLYVESASRRGLPQDLTRGGEPILFRPAGKPIARNTELPSPEMHAEAAALLTKGI
ncbi:MAG: DUF6473 family protein, partial [Pseudomonadota bacterium]